MTERWQRELTKLRQAPELPADLWDRVRSGSREPDEGISRRDRTAVIAVALVVAIAGLAVAWAIAQPFHRTEVPGGLGLVDMPPVGHAAPANLADGRPVFVVDHPDGSVEVVDAFSTHVPYGIGKLIAWCSTSGLFDDVYHGSKWSEDGTYLMGPAATGLATYTSTIEPDGRLMVESMIPPQPRPDPRAKVQPRGAYCTSSDELVYPTIAGAVSSDPAAVVASAPDGWVALRGSVVAGGPTGAQLCPTGEGAGGNCLDGAPVEGIDPALFQEYPRLTVPGAVIIRPPQTYIARVQEGALHGLTRVPTPAYPPVVP